MSETIIVAIIALIGTLAGSFGGIIASNKLVIYRIQKLEEKVEKHNSVIERVYKLEQHDAVVDEEIKNLESHFK
jgi:hypothetical protein